MKYRKPIIDALDTLLNDCVQKISDDQKKSKVDAWHIGLDDIKDVDIYRGLKKALRKNDGFLLACGQFRELCLSSDNYESLEGEAYEAWGVLLKNLNYYSTPVFKNNCISEAVRQLGGWPFLCNSTGNEATFIKKDFIKIYQSLKKRNEEFSPKLNTSCGYVEHKFIGYDSKEEIETEKIKIKQIKDNDARALKMIGNK